MQRCWPSVPQPLLTRADGGDRVSLCLRCMSPEVALFGEADEAGSQLRAPKFGNDPGCVTTRTFLAEQARSGPRDPSHVRIASINPSTPRMRITRFML